MKLILKTNQHLYIYIGLNSIPFSFTLQFQFRPSSNFFFVFTSSIQYRDLLHTVAETHMQKKFRKCAFHMYVYTRKIKTRNKGKKINVLVPSILFFTYILIHMYIHTLRKKVNKMLITTCLPDISRKTMKQNLLVARLNFLHRLYFYRNS